MIKNQGAVMLCGHGSRDKNAVLQFQSMVNSIKKTYLSNYDVESGFLEFCHPTIEQGFQNLKNLGHKKIFALPIMMFAANHIKNDLPSEINNFINKNKNIQIQFGRPLTIDPYLLKACKERIEESLIHHKNINKKNILLMVVGRGTSDPDANANIYKLSRLLHEGLGFGKTEVSYSGTAKPYIDEGLRESMKLSYPYVVVFPYFLFSGVLINRIYEKTDLISKEFPNIKIIKAQYLNNHPMVIKSLFNRLLEINQKNNNMNCQLCKYREQIIGYEQDMGKPQYGHHHHVRASDI